MLCGGGILCGFKDSDDKEAVRPQEGTFVYPKRILLSCTKVVLPMHPDYDTSVMWNLRLPNREEDEAVGLLVFSWHDS